MIPYTFVVIAALTLVGAAVLFGLNVWGPNSWGKLQVPTPLTEIRAPARPSTAASTSPMTSPVSPTRHAASQPQIYGSIDELIDASDLIIDGYVKTIELGAADDPEATPVYSEYVATVDVIRAIRNPQGSLQIQVGVGERLELADRTPPLVSETVIVSAGHTYRFFLRFSGTRYVLVSSQGLLELTESGPSPLNRDNAVARELATLSLEQLTLRVAVRSLLPEPDPDKTPR